MVVVEEIISIKIKTTVKFQKVNDELSA